MTDEEILKPFIFSREDVVDSVTKSNALKAMQLAREDERTKVFDLGTALHEIVYELEGEPSEENAATALIIAKEAIKKHLTTKNKQG